MDPIASLVPSSRDFLQAIATQRKRLALVPLVERADDVEALAAAGVAAFACAGPGPVMRAVSAAARSIAVVSLSVIATADDAFAARASGADAVVIDTNADPVHRDLLVQAVRSIRMAALANIIDEPSAARAVAATARGAYLRVDHASNAAGLAASAKGVRVLAHVPSADETALRALRGAVDAAIVESDFYLSTSFATVREELDP